MIVYNNITVIEPFKAGDEQAFRYLYDKYINQLGSFCLLKLDIKEKELRDDVIANTFIQLWQNRTKFNNIVAVGNFLFTVVRNRYLDYLRHEKIGNKVKSILAINIDDEDQNLFEYTVSEELIKQLLQVVETLPPDCKTIMKLNFFEKLSNDEIAVKLNLSKFTVKAQKVRGLKLLRQRLHI